MRTSGSGTPMVCYATRCHARQELVPDEIEKAEGSVPLLWVLYIAHTLNNSIHNLAWFGVCELEGGVSTGLLMGVKAAGRA